MSGMDRFDPWIWAAREIAKAEGLVIGAGAGMNADSGVMDGNAVLQALDASNAFSGWPRELAELESPHAFCKDPELAWGWFAHRLQLSRHTPPHTGHGILKHWADTREQGAFVLTTNTDGHFEQAGFLPERIHEIRGSLHWLQSCEDADMEPWPSEGVDLKVDGQTGRALGTLPTGPDGKLARPNVQLFGDLTWNASRYEQQRQRLDAWLKAKGETSVVVLEIGAGTHTPILRLQCADIAQAMGTRVIRINPAMDVAEDGAVQLCENAVTALARLHFLIASGEAES